MNSHCLTTLHPEINLGLYSHDSVKLIYTSVRGYLFSSSISLILGIRVDIFTDGANDALHSEFSIKSVSLTGMSSLLIRQGKHSGKVHAKK